MGISSLQQLTLILLTLITTAHSENPIEPLRTMVIENTLKCIAVLLPVSRDCEPIWKPSTSVPSVECCDKFEKLSRLAQFCPCQYSYQFFPTAICKVHVDYSNCSSSGKMTGTLPPPPPPPKSPTSIASFKKDPTAAAGAPIVPRPSMEVFGTGKSAAYKLQGGEYGIAGAVLLMYLLLGLFP